MSRTLLATRTKLGLLVALLVVAIAPARHSIAGPDVPFLATVQSEGVKTYSGAGKTYVTGELRRGSVVRVEQVIAGWYKIAPPGGSYCLISKAYVDRKRDGSVGVVNRNRAPVRAPNREVMGNSYRTQVSLFKSDEVQISGEFGSFYLIQPPKGAHVYVPAAGIRRLTPEEVQNRAAAGQLPALTPPKAAVQLPSTDLAATESASHSEPAPAGSVGPNKETSVGPAKAVPERSVSPTAVDGSETPIKDELGGTDTQGDDSVNLVDDKIANDAVTPAHAPSGDLEQAPLQPPVPANQTQAPPSGVVPTEAEIDQRLEDLERRLEDASKLPLESQPVAELLAEYRDLAREDLYAPSQQHLIEQRTTELQRRALLAETLQAITEVRRQSKYAQYDAPAKIRTTAPAPPPTPGAHDQPPFGKVLVSNVFDGTRLPRLFRVFNVRSSRTIGYLKPTPNRDLKHLLGKHVAATRKPKWDQTLKVRIFDPEHVYTLQTASGRAD